MRLSWLVSTVGLLILLLGGCKPRPAVVSTPVTSAPAAADEASADELPLAIDSLRKLAEGGSAESIKRTYFYLNQWISTYGPARQPWQSDKLIEFLPASLKETPGLERLAKNRFEADNLTPLFEGQGDESLRLGAGSLSYLQEMQNTLWLSDLAYLQQALWLHDIAERFSRRPPPRELAEWLKGLEKSIGLPEAEQLAAAERLFDWTIRNIQLDPAPPQLPTLPATAESAAGKKAQISPALRGELGPGYRLLPVQVMLYGHGDAQERARVFMQLCRQAGIDAVLLGVDEPKLQTPPPWAVAVLIGKQLYLFDVALGLPIPGPSGQGIATLEQVVAQPELLKQLDVEGQPYAISFQPPPFIIALIDAEPAALSRRMQLLQAALPRATRLALAVQPSQLEARLKGHKGIKRVSLWRVPLDAILYQVGQFHAFERDNAAFQEFHRNRSVFHPSGPLSQARNLHLQGRLADGEQERGARTLYIGCRQPGRVIDALENNPFYRASIGLQEDPKAKTEDKQAVLSQMANHARAQKQHATYWLGLSYYEEGNFTTTIEFLGDFTISADPPSPWENGARYNLARCYEDLGDLNLARQWLESDKTSPQRPGNLLRAKQLAARQAAPR